jgi:hypothetical protein
MNARTELKNTRKFYLTGSYVDTDISAENVTTFFLTPPSDLFTITIADRRHRVSQSQEWSYSSANESGGQ